METTQRRAPTALHRKKRRRGIRVAPATTVMNVRTNATNRPATSAIGPWRAKKSWVWSKYLRLRIRPLRS